MPVAPALPTKFPCWCKAVYSWGGETKRDLGFIEGDLIECLNAGDGAWWMGRLKRDRRAVGLFPSNFVQVLDESQWPGANRNVSPMVSQDKEPAKPVPQQTKSIFRKPFQAYYNAGAPNPAAAARERLKSGSTGTVNSSGTTKHKPYSSMKHAQAPTGSGSGNNSPFSSTERLARMNTPSRTGSGQRRTRATSPLPPRGELTHFRAVSPAPPPADYRPPSRAISPAPPRAVSPAPMPQYAQVPRAVSPAPMPHYDPSYRAASPAPMQYGPPRGASPIPPSPMHYGPPRGASPAPPMQYGQYGMPRGASPAPPSPAPHQQRYIAYSPAASPVPRHYDGYRDSAQFEPSSRGASPAPFDEPFDEGGASPPPPPPPAHRVPYNRGRTPSPSPYLGDPYRDGYHTPEPPSPAQREGHNLTPSPLTNAMNDVMSSLQGMGGPRGRSPSPAARAPSPGVWAPEAFTQIYNNPRKSRAQTSIGLNHEEEVEMDPESALRALRERRKSYAPQPDGMPQAGNYVSRMEDRLRRMAPSPRPQDELFMPADEDGPAPAPPPKSTQWRSRAQTSFGARRPETMYEDTRRSQSPVHANTYVSRPKSSFGNREPDVGRKPTLRHRKSAYEIAREGLGRTFTTKTNSTEASSSTNHTLMSGASAGAFSATSAGSFARRKWGIGGSGYRERSKSVVETARPAAIRTESNDSRPESPFTGVTYHSSHASGVQKNTSSTNLSGNTLDDGGLLGGLSSPKPKKNGFFKKMIESAKTGAASARNTISSSPSRPASRASKILPDGIKAIQGGPVVNDISAKETALAASSSTSSVDWVQVRRDVNRSNSLSKNERIERAERCEMMDIAVINPIEVLRESVEGDEGLDGLPVEDPADFTAGSTLALVDKNTRFIQGLPGTVIPSSLAQGYVCRPYRSDVQRLRAIFTWVSERICWEEDFEGDIDTRRAIHTKRGSAEEVAVLVMEMCAAVGLHADVVRGYLKAPGEMLSLESIAHPNHYWNAVIVDGEWRMMDCSLASPTHPRRSQYSNAGSQVAESGLFLVRPMEMCYTHIALLPEQQHLVPSIPHEVLIALPCACAPYFRNKIEIVDFDTSLLNLENLEMAHIHFFVPEDVEAIAEVEASIFARDDDGDLFETGDVQTKKALCQPEWIGGRKRYTVKAVLPGDEGEAVLKVYAGRKGLMHTIKSNPHPLAFAMPLCHAGQNPPYDFLRLHPTPHAQRHDLYVAQPQCARLAINNTFVFAIRQHPSSLLHTPGHSYHAASTSLSSAYGASSGRVSPAPFARPASAMSMISASASATGSSYSNPSNSSGSSGEILAKAGVAGVGNMTVKPAKLAIQSPSGKIIRLMRKTESTSASGAAEEGREGGDGSVWETIIKCGERGTWRGLVLADRSARWCVFAEWECV